MGLKKYLLTGAIALFSFLAGNGQNSAAPDSLTIILIRHAEKPLNGDNLTCKGLNRSLHLPAIIESKFGVPDFIYVPTLGMDITTKHSRMFQTVIPLAVKRNLSITTKYGEYDSTGLASDIRTKKGTILVVWQHKILPSIARQFLGNDFHLIWGDDDFDTIWVITFSKGIATLRKDHEGYNPSADCPE